MAENGRRRFATVFGSVDGGLADKADLGITSYVTVGKFVVAMPASQRRLKILAVVQFL